VVQSGHSSRVRRKIRHVTIMHPVASCDFLFLPCFDLSRMQNSVEYRSFLNLLKTHKLRKYVEIPQVALFGNRSLETISLLSSLLGIELPFTDEKSNEISIRIHLKEYGEKSITISTSSWNSSVDSDPLEFTPITRKSWSHLKEDIERAQNIRLTSIEESRSPRIIDITLCGPDCFDLDFLYIPGAFGADESNEFGEIQIPIENCLQSERTIILPLLSVDSLQSCLKVLAVCQRCDPNGSRFLPVVLKSSTFLSTNLRIILDSLFEKLPGCVSNRLGICLANSSQGNESKSNLAELSDCDLEEFSDLFSYVRGGLPHYQEMFGFSQLKEKLQVLQVRTLQNLIPPAMKRVSSAKENLFAQLLCVGDHLNSALKRRLFFSKWMENSLSSLESELKGIRPSEEGNCRGRMHRSYSTFREAMEESVLFQHETDFDVNLIQTEVSPIILLTTQLIFVVDQKKKSLRPDSTS
jgi:hypothetical protein